VVPLDLKLFDISLPFATCIQKGPLRVFALGEGHPYVISFTIAATEIYYYTMVMSEIGQPRRCEPSA
jgi:hypothetical protein